MILTDVLEEIKPTLAKRLGVCKLIKDYDISMPTYYICDGPIKN